MGHSQRSEIMSRRARLVGGRARVAESAPRVQRVRRGDRRPERSAIHSSEGLAGTVSAVVVRKRARRRSYLAAVRCAVAPRYPCWRTAVDPRPGAGNYAPGCGTGSCSRCRCSRGSWPAAAGREPELVGAGRGAAAQPCVHQGLCRRPRTLARRRCGGVPTGYLLAATLRISARVGSMTRGLRGPRLASEPTAQRTAHSHGRRLPHMPSSFVARNRSEQIAAPQRSMAGRLRSDLYSRGTVV